MPPVRRLTAILAADVAGYARLMGARRVARLGRTAMDSVVTSAAARRRVRSWVPWHCNSALQARIDYYSPCARTSAAGSGTTAAKALGST